MTAPINRDKQHVDTLKGYTDKSGKTHAFINGKPVDTEASLRRLNVTNIPASRPTIPPKARNERMAAREDRPVDTPPQTIGARKAAGLRETIKADQAALDFMEANGMSIDEQGVLKLPPGYIEDKNAKYGVAGGFTSYDLYDPPLKVAAINIDSAMTSITVKNGALEIRMNNRNNFNYDGYRVNPERKEVAQHNNGIRNGSFNILTER